MRKQHLIPSVDEHFTQCSSPQHSCLPSFFSHILILRVMDQLSYPNFRNVEIFLSQRSRWYWGWMRMTTGFKIMSFFFWPSLTITLALHYCQSPEDTYLISRTHSPLLQKPQYRGTARGLSQLRDPEALHAPSNLIPSPQSWGFLKKHTTPGCSDLLRSPASQASPRTTGGYDSFPPSRVTRLGPH